MANFAARLIPGVAVILCVVTCSESPVPIEKPAEARIDTRLVGTWISTPDDESGRTRVRIVPFDDHQLLAKLMEADFVDGGYAVKRALFRVLVSNVEGSTWISAMALAESGPEFDEMEDYPVWHIARLEIEESGGILFTELSDSVDLEDIGTPERLRALLWERRDDPDLMSDETTRFVRHDTPSLTYDSASQ